MNLFVCKTLHVFSVTMVLTQVTNYHPRLVLPYTFPLFREISVTQVQN